MKQGVLVTGCGSTSARTGPLQSPPRRLLDLSQLSQQETVSLAGSRDPDCFFLTIFQIQKPKCREGKGLVQGHRAGGQQIREKNLHPQIRAFSPKLPLATAGSTSPPCLQRSLRASPNKDHVLLSLALSPPGHKSQPALVQLQCDIRSPGPLSC